MLKWCPTHCSCQHDITENHISGVRDFVGPSEKRNIRPGQPPTLKSFSLFFCDHKGSIVLNRVARKQFNKEEVEGEEVSLIMIMIMIKIIRIVVSIMTTDPNSQEVSVPRWTSSTWCLEAGWEEWEAWEVVTTIIWNQTMEIIISKQTAIYPKDHHQNYNPKGGRNSNKTKPMVHKLGVTLEELYNGKVWKPWKWWT